MEGRWDLEVKRKREKELREEVEASFHIIFCMDHQKYELDEMS